MSISIFLNIQAFILVFFLGFLSWVVVRPSKNLENSYATWGEFVQSVSLILSLVIATYLLANLSDPAEIGPLLSWAMMTALYGLLLKLITQIISLPRASHQELESIRK